MTVALLPRIVLFALLAALPVGLAGCSKVLAPAASVKVLLIERLADGTIVEVNDGNGVVLQTSNEGASASVAPGDDSPKFTAIIEVIGDGEITFAVSRGDDPPVPVTVPTGERADVFIHDGDDYGVRLEVE